MWPFKRKTKPKTKVIGRVEVTGDEIWDAIQDIATKKAKDKGIDLSEASTIHGYRRQGGWDFSICWKQEFMEAPDMTRPGDTTHET